MAQPRGRRDSAEQTTDDERGPWATEATDLVRGASGGLLFGIPLIYTMEIWWIGAHTTPAQTAGVATDTAAHACLSRRRGASTGTNRSSNGAPSRATR